jgi:hypothetical protein
MIEVLLGLVVVLGTLTGFVMCVLLAETSATQDDDSGVEILKCLGMGLALCACCMVIGVFVDW